MESKINVEYHDKYVKWWNKLTDKTAEARITARIQWIKEKGHFGDYRIIGDDVWELRIHCGPGYRVYYTWVGGKMILLLCGGDKSGQKRDIETAKQLAKEAKNEKEE